MPQQPPFSSSPTHEILDTPVNQEWALKVWIDRGVFAADPDKLANTPDGTAYQDFPQGVLPMDFIRGWGTYQFFSNENGPPGSGKIALIFGKHKTDSQKKTPFRTTTRFGNHYWHPVLKEIRFIPVSGFPIYSGNVPAQRYLVREVYIPEMNEGTLFVTEEYFAPTPFSIPRHPVPTPTAISYHFLGGLRGSFPSCLHDTIDIAAQAALIGASPTGLEGQIFPKTNFKEWAPYVVSDEQNRVEAGYHRIKVTCFPPSPPKVITKTT